MRFSVVTPNFNMGRYLAATIESVLENLGPGDEYFVIDGRSGDESVEVIRRYENRLTGWISERDESYADAIGKGFTRATGDVLCWINCGDLYLAGALALAREEMRCGAGLMFGNDFYIDDTGKVLRYSHGFVDDLRSAMLYGGWSPLQDACFWRRGLYERAGGLDKAVKYAADYDMFLRLALASEARYSPFTYSAFRQHRGQKSAVGAAHYAQEKEAVRQRELRRLCVPRSVRLARRTLHWAQMSVRARIAPARYRRSDLEGRPIESLAAGQYWPRR